jgi:hypothetical protein
MSKFDKIANIRENFDDTLYQFDEFKTTKGLLYDFGKYIKENKAVLIALLTATSINALSQLSVIKDMDFGSLLSTQTQYETVINQQSSPMPTELVVKSDFSGLDMKSNLATFQDTIELSNKIVNTNYIGKEVPSLSSAGIEQLRSMPERTPLAFKNPFWENNVIELENTPINSAYYRDGEVEVTADLHSAAVLANNTAERIVINFKEVNDIINFIGVQPEDHALITKYVVYHEAAHGSFYQSREFNIENQVDKREVDLELHSDMATVMMLGTESKSLQEFNKVADYVIDFRMKRMEKTISHNTTFGVAELKQLVNKNPDLLNMKPSDVASFTGILAKQISNHKFTPEQLASLKDSGVDFSAAKIVNDIKEGNNDVLYNEWGPKIGTFVTQKVREVYNDARMEKLATRMSATFQKDSSFDVVTSMMNAHNKWDHKKTAQELNEFVKNHSILDQGMNSAIDYKVQMETLSSLKNNQQAFSQKQQSMAEVKQSTQNTFKI